MKFVVVIFFGLGMLCLVALFTCFGLSIWTADARWSQMGVLLILPTVMLLGTAGIVGIDAL